MSCFPFEKTGPSDSPGLHLYFTAFSELDFYHGSEQIFSVEKVKLFQILCLNFIGIKLRDRVILPSVCNSVIPVGAVCIHSAVPAAVVLPMWKKEVDFFQAL